MDLITALRFKIINRSVKICLLFCYVTCNLKEMNDCAVTYRNCQPSCSYNAETESRTSQRTSNILYRRRNSADQWRQNFRINSTASMLSAFEDDSRTNDKDGILKWEYLIFGLMIAISTLYLNKRFGEVFKFLHEMKLECMYKQPRLAQKQTSEQKTKNLLVLKSNTSDILNDLLKQTMEIYATVNNRSVDFASAGGVIISTSGELHNIGVYPNLPHMPDIFKKNGPSAILQDSDHCWTFQGSSASTVIQLIGNISISGVSLGYLRKQSKENNSAPREFSVWGLTHAHDREGKCLEGFTYNNEGPQLQDFAVHNRNYYKFLELKIDSNYGNSEYTSVHRLHIYGELKSKK